MMREHWKFIMYRGRPAVLTLAVLSICQQLACIGPLRAAERVKCWMNSSQQTCVITPWGKDGFEISFSGSAIFRFVPAGPPTTDRRRMRDEQGRIWLMSGHHSFTLEEEGGFHNHIRVD